MLCHSLRDVSRVQRVLHLFFLVAVFLENVSFVNSWFLTDYTYCKFYECCNKEHVPYNVEELHYRLNDFVFGQPFVNELITIVKAHKQAINSQNGSNKALVLSLHGWPGVGKNYVTTMIADSLFKKGMNSQYVKFINGERDFKGDIEQSKIRLMNEIKEVVQKCNTALIIFDEMDKMPSGILDIISANVDFHRSVGNVDYRKAIFVFISNMAGTLIAEKLLQLYDDGETRNNLSFHQFEPIIRQAAFQEGGFRGSALVANHLIDHYIPFLPLEQQHIEKCAKVEFSQRSVYASTKLLEEATSVVTYGPEHRPIFANNGCKRIHKQVVYVIQKHKMEL